MKRTIKILVIIAAISAFANALTVDFAPIKLGNVWKYQCESSSGGFFPGKSSYIKTILITNVDSIRADSIKFIITVRDSGYVVDTSILKDSSYSQTGIKTKDSVKIENNISYIFFWSTKETAPISTSTYYEKYTSVNNKIIGYYVKSLGGPPSGEYDSLIMAEGIGLLFAYYSSWDHSGVSNNSSVTLINFNGLQIKIDELINIKEENNKKSGCGSGAIFAFIPPIGFKIKRAINKRKIKTVPGGSP
jgi:hypothetical protein